MPTNEKKVGSPNLIFQTILFLIFLLYLALRFSSPIQLITADLGRHLKNGEELLHHSSQVLTQNYYSYTEPENRLVNHHWLTGIFFYGIWKWGGFQALAVFYTALFLLSFCVYFDLARRRGGFSFAALAAVLAVPLMMSRPEIRPEGMSVLFLGIVLTVLCRVFDGSLTARWLWVIPALEVVWVNTHILFFLGPLLVLVFYLRERISNTCLPCRRKLAAVGISSGLACLVNPFGLAGALVPFSIFDRYSYELVENQSLIFLLARFPQNFEYLYWIVIAALALVSAGFLARPKRLGANFVDVVLTLIFSLLALKMMRAVVLLGFMFVPLMASLWSRAAQSLRPRARAFVRQGAAGAAAFIFIVSAWSGHSRAPRLFAGLRPGVQASAEFFKHNALKGPIFNNYDIGGYLIFYLFPRERVFVDNRPEAYTVSFFKDVYIPMQEKEEIWKREQARFGFNVIYFYRLDLTPWAQPFLIRRLSDPEWAPVFVDDFTLILLKRNSLNQDLIRRFELPKHIFHAVH